MHSVLNVYLVKVVYDIVLCYHIVSGVMVTAVNHAAHPARLISGKWVEPGDEATVFHVPNFWQSIVKSGIDSSSRSLSKI